MSDSMVLKWTTGYWCGEDCGGEDWGVVACGDAWGAGLAKTIGDADVIPFPSWTVIAWLGLMSGMLSFAPLGQMISKLKVLPSSGGPRPKTTGSSLWEQ
jgi:hypothetical protein